MNDMEEARLRFSWPACLAVRGNLLSSEIPHIPILIEDIPRYVVLPDFERNCIKNVQTIGEILPGEARVVELQSVSSIGEAKITLNLETLPINDVYFKDERGRYLPVWETSRVFKVFGMLEKKDDDVVLMANKLLKIQDIQGSVNTLSLLSAIVRPMLYQYKEVK